LIDWLYVVARHKAGRSQAAAHAHADIVQDSMMSIFTSLIGSRQKLADADNPAAMLETITARAVAAGQHRTHMSGFGGVAPNGQHWKDRYPRPIGGTAALRILDEVPAVHDTPSPHAPRVAGQVADWAAAHLRVLLTDDALHATVYVVDQIVSGVSRAALVRGGHSCLTRDPALRHLGFSARAAGTFAKWLLGRRDPGHVAPSVLDAALADRVPDDIQVQAWRQTALVARFATEV
jgi:hypothetical protein